MMETYKFCVSQSFNIVTSTFMYRRYLAYCDSKFLKISKNSFMPGPAGGYEKGGQGISMMGGGGGVAVVRPYAESQYVELYPNC